MRVIVDLKKDHVVAAVQKLDSIGFVTDQPAPQPDAADPDICHLVGEVPLNKLHDLQLTMGVVTWHIAEDAA